MTGSPPPGGPGCGGGDGAGTGHDAGGVEPGEVSAAIADAHRREWAFVLAATARVAGDLDLAEECVQDAYAAALTAWTRQGVPRNTGAWRTTAERLRESEEKKREGGLWEDTTILI